MSQNLIIPNKDNKVVYVFGGIDLTLATDIQVQFGSESYSLINDPLIVIVDSATELSLNLSATAETGRVFSTVTYFDGASVNGTDITSQALGNSDQIIVAIGSQLIIEDGSIVTNANSFTTDAELKDYAQLRGFALPATEPERDTLQLKAIDYLFSQENFMKGRRTSELQTLPYPRRGVTLNKFNLSSDKIPQELKNACLELAIQSYSNELLVNASAANVSSFSVDGVYSESYHKGGSVERVTTGRASAYLSGLMLDFTKMVRV